MQIFVSGSLAYDRIMDFPGRFADHILPEKIHILNVCFMVNGLTERFGGTAGNIAYNLALLQEKPVILATAGKDFGPYREWLTSLDLPLDGIKEIPAEFTAGAYITTDLSDNQITGFNPGAMKHRSEYRFDGVDPAAALAIVAPGSLEDMLAYTRAYKARGVPYIFDPGQSIPAWDGDALREMADQALALIVNDYELEMFQQKTGLHEAEILGLTPILITTRGDRARTCAAPLAGKTSRWWGPAGSWTPPAPATPTGPGCSRGWPWGFPGRKRSAWARSWPASAWRSRAPRNTGWRSTSSGSATSRRSGRRQPRPRRGRGGSRTAPCLAPVAQASSLCLAINALLEWPQALACVFFLRSPAAQAKGS